VIWDCLVEEPTLFLRVFLEKLTHRDKQDELIFLLRKLLYFVESLPAQTAHSLFNYIVSSIFLSFYFKFTVVVFFVFISFPSFTLCVVCLRRHQYHIRHNYRSPFCSTTTTSTFTVFSRFFQPPQELLLILFLRFAFVFICQFFRLSCAHIV